MNFWQELTQRFRNLFGLRPARDRLGVEESPPLLRPRVLLITYNPVIRHKQERRLTEVLGWRDGLESTSVKSKAYMLCDEQKSDG